MQVHDFLDSGLFLFQCCFGVDDDNNEEFLDGSLYNYKKEMMAQLLKVGKKNVVPNDSA